MPKSSAADPGQALGLHLREIYESDHAAIKALLADRDLQHLLLAYPPEEGAADFESWLARRTGNAGLQLRVVADSENRFCGFVQAGNIHFRGRIGWLGMALDPAWRGKGVGRWALRAFFSWVQEGLALRKVLLEVRCDNVPAISLYRREGFRDVGIYRDHYVDGARTHDVLVMERLLGEPDSQGEQT